MSVYVRLIPRSFFFCFLIFGIRCRVWLPRKENNVRKWEKKGSCVLCFVFLCFSLFCFFLVDFFFLIFMMVKVWSSLLLFDSMVVALKGLKLWIAFSFSVFVLFWTSQTVSFVALKSVKRRELSSVDPGVSPFFFIFLFMSLCCIINQRQGFASNEAQTALNFYL